MSNLFDDFDFDLDVRKIQSVSEKNANHRNVIWYSIDICYTEQAGCPSDNCLTNNCGTGDCYTRDTCGGNVCELR